MNLHVISFSHLDVFFCDQLCGNLMKETTFLIVENIENREKMILGTKIEGKSGENTPQVFSLTH